MSIALMSLAWKADLPTGRKMVLLALCDNANDQGECYPSVSNIAERCSMGERTVQSHLADMEDDGILSRHFRNGRSSIYVINPRRFRTPAESAPPQNSHPTPAESAPLPPQISHPTPADFAPITIKEPSLEPSLKRDSGLAKRGTRLQADWRLPKSYGEWALENFPQWSEEMVRKIAEKFHDHWLANGQTKKDWEATWRNWCRNELKSWSGLARGQPSVTKTVSEKRQDWVDRLRGGQGNGNSDSTNIIDV